MADGVLQGASSVALLSLVKPLELFRRFRLLRPSTYLQAPRVSIAQSFATNRGCFNCLGGRQVCVCFTARVFGFARAAAQELAALIAGSVEGEPDSTDEDNGDDGADAADVEQEFGGSSDDSDFVKELFEEAGDLCAGSEPGSPTVDCDSDVVQCDATLAEGQAFAAAPVAASSAASSSGGPGSVFHQCSISGRGLASALTSRCPRRSSSLASSSGWSTSRAATAADFGVAPKHGAGRSGTPTASAAAAAGTQAADDELLEDFVSAASELGEDCDSGSQVTKAVPNVLSASEPQLRMASLGFSTVPSWATMPAALRSKYRFRDTIL